MIWLIMAIGSLLPGALVRFCFRMLARVLLLFVGAGMFGTMHQLRIAFGREKSDAELRAIGRRFWLHFAQALAETITLTRWSRAQAERHVDCSELDAAIERCQALTKEAQEAAQAKGKRGPAPGIIFVSGHMGTWEIGPYTMALRGHPVRLVHNPGTVEALFELLKRTREASGMKVLSRSTHPWALKKILDRGEWLVIALDLNAGRHGEFVPFFDVLASTYTTPAALQQVTQCPIIVTTIQRQPDNRHKFHAWDIIPYEAVPADDASRQRAAITQRINHALEKCIRTYPEQWLWHYRRWRKRPKDETPGPDGLPPRATASLERAVNNTPAPSA